MSKYYISTLELKFYFNLHNLHFYPASIDTTILVRELRNIFMIQQFPHIALESIKFHCFWNMIANAKHEAPHWLDLNIN